jgi:hypothetical protein
LINQYTWSGAHLIMIGFFLQQAIVAALFLEHPSELTQAKLAEEDEKTFTDKVGGKRLYKRSFLACSRKWFIRFKKFQVYPSLMSRYL